jgi:hypothetical protein
VGVDTPGGWRYSSPPGPHRSPPRRRRRWNHKGNKKSGRADYCHTRRLDALHLLAELHDVQGRLDDLKRLLRELVEEE